MLPDRVDIGIGPVNRVRPHPGSSDRLSVGFGFARLGRVVVYWCRVSGSLDFLARDLIEDRSLITHSGPPRRRTVTRQ